jgi:hypothetical protein
MACEGVRVKRCPADESHAVGWRHCNVCEPPRVVQALCAKCGQWFSAPGIAQHERTCQPAKRQHMDAAAAQSDDERRVLRVVYVLSQTKGERGQLAVVADETFPCWLTKMGDDDGGWVDAYDALLAALHSKGAVRVVHVVQDRKSVRDHISEQQVFVTEESGPVDVLMWPNWLFELLHVCKTLAALHEWVELLRQYERVHRCVVFPSIEYALFFARKDVWTHRVRLPPTVHTIPTHYVYGGSKWQADVLAFARTQQTTRLVMKRAVGECGHQVWDEVGVEGSGGGLSGLPAKLDSLPYMVQPFVQDFAQERELRLYVVEGTLSFGVESWWEGATKLRYDCWSEESDGGARAAAERVVQLIAQECCAEAAHFLRLDMVHRRADDGHWWLNEAEFFGNAHLLFSVMPQPRELFDTLVEALGRWLVRSAQ